MRAQDDGHGLLHTGKDTRLNQREGHGDGGAATLDDGGEQGCQQNAKQEAASGFAADGGHDGFE